MRSYLRLCILSLLLSLFQHALAADDPLDIVFIPKSSDQVFWDFMRRGVDRAIAEEGNISLIWRGPSYNDDHESQIRILQTYIKPGIDAIIIAPTDQQRLAEPVAEAARLGIPVIVVDSALAGDSHRHFISTDNRTAGWLAAEHLVGLLGGQGRVVVFRIVKGSASTENRAMGFLQYIEEQAPGIQIISDSYGGGSRGKAMHSARALLPTLEDIDGIFAVNESSADGMLRALRQVGLDQKPRFVGFDATDFLLEGLESGDLDGLMVQDPDQMGYLAIKAAVAAIAGRQTYDKIIFTDAVMVTRENLTDPDIEKLLCVSC